MLNVDSSALKRFLFFRAMSKALIPFILSKTLCVPNENQLLPSLCNTTRERSQPCLPLFTDDLLCSALFLAKDDNTPWGNKWGKLTRESNIYIYFTRTGKVKAETHSDSAAVIRPSDFPRKAACSVPVLGLKFCPESHPLPQFPDQRFEHKWGWGSWTGRECSSGQGEAQRGRGGLCGLFQVIDVS